MNPSKTLLLALALSSVATAVLAADEPPTQGTTLPAADLNAVDPTGTFSVNPRMDPAPPVFVNPQDLGSDGSEPVSPSSNLDPSSTPQG